MSGLSKTALALVIVGALNWLLVGLFSFDLVAAIFGQMSILSRVVYAVVGFCGIYCIGLLVKPSEAASHASARRTA